MHTAIFSTSSFRSVAGLAVLTLLVSLSLSSAGAAVITTGDVVPSNPAIWSTTAPTIGNTANGSIVVNGGSTTGTTGTTNLAMTPGVTGTLTVDGVGSTWDMTSGFGIKVGTSSLPQNLAGGTGILNITNGGAVISSISRGNGVNIGAAFNTKGYLNISNGGVLTRGGTVGDGVLSTGIVTVTGAGSQWANTNDISIGEKGTGLLTITNGATMGVPNSLSSAVVGRYTTSTGHVLVDGAGSSWTTGSGGLQVGLGFANGPGTGGIGVVTVTNGATVTNLGATFLGYNASATGAVMLNGVGSSWASIPTATGCNVAFPGSSVCGLNIGTLGTGRVSVSDGARLTTNALYVNNKSNLTVDLGTGSTVTVGGGTGAVTNDGTIRMVAKATAANGTYAPITAGTWNGTGTVQALGGVYDPITHSVTVSSAAIGQAGVATTIDRSVTQRMLITDSATGQQVGASFQATQSPSNISLIASLMGPSQLSLLQGLLDPGKAVLGAWNFSATGYTAGDPVYLSLQLGGGQKFYDLDVWHFDGTGWAKYLNSDLAYDNKFASFVANGFSGYAISGLAAVPIPAAVWLFGSGLAALAGLARRKVLMKGDMPT